MDCKKLSLRKQAKTQTFFSNITTRNFENNSAHTESIYLTLKKKYFFEFFPSNSFVRSVVSETSVYCMNQNFFLRQFNIYNIYYVKVPSMGSRD
jgi:hypothetical protein